MSLLELPISGAGQSGRGRDLNQQPQAGWMWAPRTLTQRGGCPLCQKPGEIRASEVFRFGLLPLFFL